jgi:predicted membrane-bound spermidine synthase
MTTLDLAASGDQTVRTDRLARWTRVLGVLLFCSGFPALVYQLAWQRALSGILGDTGAAAFLLAGFMLGLALGGLAGGWLSKRQTIAALPLLAAIELMTGVLGFASPRVFGSIGAAAAVALVIVSALPMGAALPLLVGGQARRCGHVGSAVGLLSCINNLGAGAACLVGLLLLTPLPFLDLRGEIHLAAAINLAVALGALAAHWRDRYDQIFTAPQASKVLPSRKPMLAFSPLLGLAAAGGFVALSYEIFFFRTVTDATGAGAFAFAATLGAFLLGLAFGARRAGDNCTALTRDGAMRRAVGALMKASLLGLLFLPLLDHLAWLDRASIGVAVLMVYLVARFWGSLMPYLAELGVAADGQAGMRTAFLYGAGCLGAAAGALFTGFALLDRIGLVATGMAVVVAGLACVVLLIVALKMPRAEKILRASLAVGLGLLAMAVIPGWSANVPERLPAIDSPKVAPPEQAAENFSR